MKTKICFVYPRRAGFTLIEMLVVIAILALLIAIVVPSTGRALERARQTQCTSNLRQIGQAFQMYVLDPGNRSNLFPSVVDPTGGGAGTPWFVTISPFLQKQATIAGDLDMVFRCPVWGRIYERGAASDWNQLGYGMNYYLTGSPTRGWPWGNAPAPYNTGTSYRHRLSDMENPSGTVLVADEWGWNWGLHSTNFAAAFGAGGYFDPALGAQRGFRHGKSANYLFADGRVAGLTAEQLEPNLAK